jgi:hypothetical protein
MKKNIMRILNRSKRFAQDRIHQVTSSAPQTEDVRITNETVAARREEVLGSARKFIYPLDAPRHRVVKLSVAILIIAIIGFFSFCILELYKFQSTSTFIYGVTQVVPFPVMIIDNRQIVSYNDYLFELRHYIHYYETQQHTDFQTKAGQQQLAAFKRRSLDEVLQKTYVQQLADKNNVLVSEHDIDAAVALVRTQNHLGANDHVFQSVLNEFWGWSVDDFRRELRGELLAQKVVDKLDTRTHARANQTLAKLEQGTDFAVTAKEISDDQATKANGGDYGSLIDHTNIQLSPQVLDVLFKLQPGQYSTIINSGYSLEIVKVVEVQGTQVHAAHISFNFQPINTYTNQQSTNQHVLRLIHTE